MSLYNYTSVFGSDAVYRQRGVVRRNRGGNIPKEPIEARSYCKFHLFLDPPPPFSTTGPHGTLRSVDLCYTNRNSAFSLYLAIFSVSGCIVYSFPSFVCALGHETCLSREFAYSLISEHFRGNRNVRKQPKKKVLQII